MHLLPLCLREPLSMSKAKEIGEKKRHSSCCFSTEYQPILLVRVLLLEQPLYSYMRIER